MFIKKPPIERSLLEEAIDDIFREMAVMNADSKEYSRMVKQLQKLYALKEDNTCDRVSKDTMALIVANLVGIVIIVGYERSNIVTSKALNFIFKLR